MPTLTEHSLRIRDENAADAHFIRSLFDEVRSADFAAAGLPERELDQLLDLQFRAQTQQIATAHPEATGVILEIDGRAVGHAVVDRHASGLELVDLAVLGSERQRGIGTAYLRQLTDEADVSHRAVTLQVWFANTTARRLYERFGFSATESGTGHLQLTRPAASPAASHAAGLTSVAR